MNAVEALSCQELVELVTDYLEGALAPGDLRRFAQNEVAVPRKTLRTIQQHPDFSSLEARRAVDRVGHQHLELIPVLGQ